jgi:hypothetical protein
MMIQYKIGDSVKRKKTILIDTKYLLYDNNNKKEEILEHN